MGIFERLLDWGSLECLEALLVHQHVAFPNFSGGISFISLDVIVQATYLGSRALVAPVIASNFLLDSHLFLLEMISVNNSRPFLF
jgi:hypothetical protein